MSVAVQSRIEVLRLIFPDGRIAYEGSDFHAEHVGKFP